MYAFSTEVVACSISQAFIPTLLDITTLLPDIPTLLPDLTTPA